MANVTISNISPITSTTMIGLGGANVLLPLSDSSDGGTTWVTNVSTLTDIKTFMFKSGDIDANSVITTTANIDSTGNVSANYFLGNGSQLTGLGLHYSDTDVANVLASFGSNTIGTTGNITGGNLITTGLVDVTGNVSAATVIVSYDVNATGNVSAAYLKGNGSELSLDGITSDISSSANIAANNISITSLLQLPALDNATRNALDASVGQVVYSTDDDTVQVFLANSTWGNLALV